MSTQITNGYRVNPDMLPNPVHLGDVLSRLQHWYKARALPIIRQEITGKTAFLVSQYIDAVYTGAFELPRRAAASKISDLSCPVSEVRHEINRCLVDAHNNPSENISEIDQIDVSLQVGVTELHDTEGVILVLPFLPDVGGREIVKTLKEQNWLEYFGYWNHVDPDPRCSEQEWDFRRRCWNEALPGVGVPANHMLFFSPTVARDVTPLCGDSIEEVAAEIPARENRAICIAEDLALRDRAAAIQAERPSDYMRAMTWTREEEEGKAYVESIRQKVLPLLPEIDTDLLETPFGVLREKDFGGVLDVEEE